MSSSDLLSGFLSPSLTSTFCSLYFEAPGGQNPKRSLALDSRIQMMSVIHSLRCMSSVSTTSSEKITHSEGRTAKEMPEARTTSLFSSSTLSCCFSSSFLASFFWISKSATPSSRSSPIRRSMAWILSCTSSMRFTTVGSVSICFW